MSADTRTWWRRKAHVVALVAGGVFAVACAVPGNAVTYDLPADAERYTLTVSSEQAVTTWEFTSERPTEDGRRESQPCISEFAGDRDGGPCTPEPLIFLKYDLGLDIHNQVPAGRDNPVMVTGYYAEGLDAPPAVVHAQVEVSVDGGDSWQQLATEATGEANTFTATVPAVGAGVESVALRVSATDEDGNTVEQTLPEAYTVR